MARADLRAACDALARVIPRAGANAALTQLHLTFAAGKLVLQGSNGEVDLRLEVRAEVSGGGCTLVPFAPLAEIVRGLPGEAAELRLQERLEVQSGAFTTHLATALPGPYPELTFPAGGDRVSTAALVRALEQVAHAVAQEEHRAVFRGVQLELHPSRLVAVASDGFRLAVREVAWAGAEREGVRKLVIPGRSAQELVRLFRAGEDELSLWTGPGRLCLHGEGRSLALKLLEGEFPDYTRVIPQAFVLEATCDAADLRAAIARLKVLADRANHRVDLSFSGLMMELHAEGDWGKGTDAVAVRLSGQTPFTAAYNAGFLTDALAGVDGPVTLHFSGPVSPTLLTCRQNPGYRAVVVPLRV